MLLSYFQRLRTSRSSLPFIRKASSLSLSTGLNTSRLKSSFKQQFLFKNSIVSTMPPKRKRSSVAAVVPSNSTNGPILPPFKATGSGGGSVPAPRQNSRRGKVDTNPDHNPDIMDDPTALRASPDADGKGEALEVSKIVPPINGAKIEAANESPLSELESLEATSVKKQKKPTKSSVSAKKGSDEIKAFIKEQAAKRKAETSIIKKEDDGEDEWDKRQDPDGDEAGPAEDIDAVKAAASRPPPVHSDYLPLPWKGRIGYACLNTYLRFSNPPVFSSRTCRIASILEHRHPLQDPSQPEHASKNRPDKTKPADEARGQRYVEELGLANARDMIKMIRWNDKYNIKFLRLSSEAFPFASHEVYGYKLAPFASEVLAEVGKVAAELGHRLTTHPGQFTQLGSPRQGVIDNAIRDLEYHDEMLSLLKMPPQEDRNAVMILHLGGTFGDKAATIDRFRENYKKLPQSVKNRLVLENDDVSWSVHDLLPLCEELNIPMVLDYHHHNIVFDSTQLREGTKDIMDLYPRIKATWDRKGIKQKMHYSEPTPQAITGRQRRKHNPRPATLPPCDPDMDLMIEAKDKEQAVFELMRTFKLPGWNTFNDIIPYERDDDNKPLPKKAKKKKTKKQIANEIEEFGKELSEEEDPVKTEIPEDEIGMGGPQNRVYWPPGMEEYLRPKKREVKKKAGADEESPSTPANFQARLAATKRAREAVPEDFKEKLAAAATIGDVAGLVDEMKTATVVGDDEDAKQTAKRAVTKKAPVKRSRVKDVPTPSETDHEDDDLSMPDLSDDQELPVSKAKVPARQSGRRRANGVTYKEDEDSGFE